MNRSILPAILICFIFQQSFGQFTRNGEGLAHTFSIVAQRPRYRRNGRWRTKPLVQRGDSRKLGEAGVGVVATQSFVNKSYGIRGLGLMKEGKTAQEALSDLLAEDDGREVRQVAMLDSNGNVAAHTGKGCIDYASHIVGKNYSVQSNMMLNNKVCPAMSKAFEQSEGLPLAERVMKALEAAQAVGGDIRGKQSAAILVVEGKSEGKPWNERLVDLRVDDQRRAPYELARLLKLYRAYEHMNNGDLYTEKNNMEEAMKEYRAAMQLFPSNLEMQYWTAITLANNKKIKDAAAMLAKIYAEDSNWRELTRRLPKVNLLNVSADDLKSLTR